MAKWRASARDSRSALGKGSSGGPATHESTRGAALGKSLRPGWLLPKGQAAAVSAAAAAAVPLRGRTAAATAAADGLPEPARQQSISLARHSRQLPSTSATPTSNRASGTQSGGSDSTYRCWLFRGASGWQLVLGQATPEAPKQVLVAQASRALGLPEQRLRQRLGRWVKQATDDAWPHLHACMRRIGGQYAGLPDQPGSTAVGSSERDVVCLAQLITVTAAHGVTGPMLDARMANQLNEARASEPPVAADEVHAVSSTAPSSCPPSTFVPPSPPATPSLAATTTRSPPMPPSSSPTLAVTTTPSSPPASSSSPILAVTTTRPPPPAFKSSPILAVTTTRPTPPASKSSPVLAATTTPPPLPEPSSSPPHPTRPTLPVLNLDTASVASGTSPSSPSTHATTPSSALPLATPKPWLKRMALALQPPPSPPSLLPSTSTTTPIDSPCSDAAASAVHGHLLDLPSQTRMPDLTPAPSPTLLPTSTTYLSTPVPSPTSPFPAPAPHPAVPILAPLHQSLPTSVLKSRPEHSELKHATPLFVGFGVTAGVGAGVLSAGKVGNGGTTCMLSQDLADASMLRKTSDATSAAACVDNPSFVPSAATRGAVCGKRPVCPAVRERMVSRVQLQVSPSLVRCSSCPLEACVPVSNLMRSASCPAEASVTVRAPGVVPEAFVTRSALSHALEACVPAANPMRSLSRSLEAPVAVSDLSSESEACAPRADSSSESEACPPRSDPSSEPEARVPRADSSSEPEACVPRSDPSSEPEARVPRSDSSSEPGPRLPRADSSSEPEACALRSDLTSESEACVPRSDLSSELEACVPRADSSSESEACVPRSDLSSDSEACVPKSELRLRSKASVPRSDPGSQSEVAAAKSDPSSESEACVPQVPSSLAPAHAAPLSVICPDAAADADKALWQVAASTLVPSMSRTPGVVHVALGGSGAQATFEGRPGAAGSQGVAWNIAPSAGGTKRVRESEPSWLPPRGVIVKRERMKPEEATVSAVAAEAHAFQAAPEDPHVSDAWAALALVREENRHLESELQVLRHVLTAELLRNGVQPHAAAFAAAHTRVFGVGRVTDNSDTCAPAMRTDKCGSPAPPSVQDPSCPLFVKGATCTHASLKPASADSPELSLSPWLHPIADDEQEVMEVQSGTAFSQRAWQAWQAGVGSACPAAATATLDVGFAAQGLLSCKRKHPGLLIKVKSETHEEPRNKRQCIKTE